MLEEVLNPDDAAALISAPDGATARIASALAQHPVLTLAAQPRRLSAAELRCNAAVEAPLQAPVLTEDGVRADLGIVLFLNDGRHFQGGALQLDVGDGPAPVEYSAGDALLHNGGADVMRAPVTAGAAWTAHVAVESLVRQPERREVLYDLSCSVELLQLFAPEHDALALLRRSRDQLLRLWAD